MELQGKQFGEQLPMFMTAGEIRAKHAVWDPDRILVGNGGKTRDQVGVEIQKEEGGQWPSPAKILSRRTPKNQSSKG